MRRNSLFPLAVAFTAFCLASTVAVAAPARLAEPLAGASSIEWQLNASFESALLTVSTPSGAVIRREFLSGQVPSFNLFDQKGQTRPAGNYNYELRAVPAIDAGVRNRLAAARAAGDDRAAIAEQARAGLRDDLVQSGSFAIVNGAFAMGGASENPSGPRNAAAAAVRNVTAADQVIPDDLIVQGSGCVGLDCVNNENFGFDTIRLKENNTRIHFDDTSNQAGFPANDWRLIANDSASGGSSKFSIEDSTGAKTPFTITAGAATNSIFADSIGRIGMRTSTPVLDLHINTSNTPAIRLEQNNSGGFTAQTWDIGANEANFFVRDVTHGSLLSFRIRPGAPTSSLDISSDGDVGVGTASPDNKLHVVCSGAGATCAKMENTNVTGFSGFEFATEAGATVANIAIDNTANTFRFNAISGTPIVIMTNSTERIRFPAPGTDFIQATNGAELTAGGIWQDNSSRDSKQDIVDLSHADALDALKELNPVHFRYKAEPDEEYLGFIAEDLPDLVATSDHKHLSSTDVVAVLTKVVQQQQQTIDQLAARLAELERGNN